MTSCLVETSALLTWLLSEDDANLVRDALNGAERVCCSKLLFIESERCLIRSESRGQLSSAAVQKLRGELANFERQWQVLELTPAIQSRARRAYPVEPIRTLDALHLATALEFAMVYADLRILSLDQRILDNLVPLGLQGALSRKS